MADPELTPVVVQDAESGAVLMLAYADEEALRRTRESGEAWFWSRSRQELWRKGATSGNTLAVVEIRDDCDGDALLYRVSLRSGLSYRGRVVLRALAVARHQGASGDAARRLVRRRTARRGRRGAAQKVGEEGVEAALAGAGESDERLVEELADLWFHSYVLLAARGLGPDQVERELARRHAPRPTES